MMIQPAAEIMTARFSLNSPVSARSPLPSGTSIAMSPSVNTAVRATSARLEEKAYAKNEGSSRALQGERRASTPVNRAARAVISVMRPPPRPRTR